MPQPAIGPRSAKYQGKGVTRPGQYPFSASRSCLQPRAPCGRKVVSRLVTVCWRTCLMVAAVAEAILCRESSRTRDWAASTFGLHCDSAPRWCWPQCAVAHYFAEGFRVSEGRVGRRTTCRRDGRICNRSERSSPRAQRHDLATSALLRAEFAARFSASSWIPAITGALGAHHGDSPRSPE